MNNRRGYMREILSKSETSESNRQTVVRIGYVYKLIEDIFANEIGQVGSISVKDVINHLEEQRVAAREYLREASKVNMNSYGTGVESGELSRIESTLDFIKGGEWEG